LYKATGGFRGGRQKGEIGVEIEVEGRNLPRGEIDGWVLHEDGSLRGESAEYVFRGPASRKDYTERLSTLSRIFTESGSIINQSYRTSVHVHLNVQDWLIRHIYNNIFLYTIFEDCLSNIAGKDRSGNIFCLRAKDAEYYLHNIRNAIITDNIGLIAEDNMRYSAVNTASLFRHGSLEFRQFRGTVDMELIQEWIEILLRLRDVSVEYPNPISLVQDVSLKGPIEFASKVFSNEIINQFPDGWALTIDENTRLIQHAAYAHEWLETPQIEEKKKTRSKKITIPNQLNNTLDQLAAQQPAGDIRDFMARWNLEPNVVRGIEPNVVREEDEI
jgi:hypothetical protein